MIVQNGFAFSAGIFDLGYKAGDGEHREISVACIQQDAATSQ